MTTLRSNVALSQQQELRNVKVWVVEDVTWAPEDIGCLGVFSSFDNVQDAFDDVEWTKTSTGSWHGDDHIRRYYACLYDLNSRTDV